MKLKLRVHALTTEIDPQNRPTAMMCELCGALIGSEFLHKEWHEKRFATAVMKEVSAKLNPPMSQEDQLIHEAFAKRRSEPIEANAT